MHEPSGLEPCSSRAGSSPSSPGVPRARAGSSPALDSTRVGSSLLAPSSWRLEQGSTSRVEPLGDSSRLVNTTICVAYSELCLSVIINPRGEKRIPGLHPVYEDSHPSPERSGEYSGGVIGILCALPEGFPLDGRFGERSCIIYLNL